MVRVGVVGYGSMGKTHAQSYGLLPNAKLVGLADQVEKNRQDFTAAYQAPAFETLERMLESVELDLVDVCLPTFLHRQGVETAARAGKHVLCEKPIALTLEDADAMIAAASRAGVQFTIAHVLRFWPEYVAIKKLVDSGRLGRVLWAAAERLSACPAWSWENWLLQAPRSGGAIVDLHIHDLDFMAYLLGKPKQVIASGVYRDRSLDTVCTTLSGFPGGAVAVAEGCWALPPSFPFEMGLRLNMERGAIVYCSCSQPSLAVYPAAGEPEHPPLPEPEMPAGVNSAGGGNISALGGYFNEVQYFVNCLDRGEAWQTVTAQDARLALQLALAATESATTGRPVEIR